MTTIEKLNHVFDKHKDKTVGAFHDVLWQIMVNKMRKADLTSCFVCTFPHPNGYEVGIADRDRAGFTPVNFGFNSEVTVQERYQVIEQLNKDVFELEPHQADIIICSTMSHNKSD